MKLPSSHGYQFSSIKSFFMSKVFLDMSASAEVSPVKRFLKLSYLPLKFPFSNFGKTGGVSYIIEYDNYSSTCFTFFSDIEIS